MMRPIGYTYESDTHCPLCTAKRFGESCEGIDREGNTVGVFYEWDYEGCHCADCGNEIAEPFGYSICVNVPGYLPTDEPIRAGSLLDALTIASDEIAFWGPHFITATCATDDDVSRAIEQVEVYITAAQNPARSPYWQTVQYIEHGCTFTLGEYVVDVVPWYHELLDAC